jgi:hypothetical protein
MNNLSSIVKQLKAEPDRVRKQLLTLEAHLRHLLVPIVGASPAANGGR